MKNFLKYITYLLIVSMLSSCAKSIAYKYDYGKKNKTYRYLDLKEKQFAISVSVSQNRNEIRIAGLSKYNAPHWIEDTISKVNFIDEKLSFPDGTILEKGSRPLGLSAKCYDNEGKEIPCLTYFYTCADFKHKLRKNKHLNLKITYDIDSVGVLTHCEKEYELVKKKYYRVAVH